MRSLIFSGAHRKKNRLGRGFSAAGRWAKRFDDALAARLHPSRHAAGRRRLGGDLLSSLHIAVIGMPLIDVMDALKDEHGDVDESAIARHR